MGRSAAFPTKMHVRPTLSYRFLSKCIRAVRSEFSLGTLLTKDPNRLQADSNGSDKTARMRRLIRVFPGRTCNLVESAVFRLICILNLLQITLIKPRAATYSVKHNCESGKGAM